MATSNEFKLDKLNLLVYEDEDTGGDDSGSSSSGAIGSGAPLIDLSVFGLVNHLFLEKLRQGEALFGQVPLTTPPKTRSQGQGKGVPTHPLFRDSQYFSGIFDDKSNPSPANNKDAAEHIAQLQLNPSLQPGMKHQMTAAPVIAPTLTKKS